MSDWQTKKIKALGQVVTGKTPPTDNPDYFADGSELFVSPKDLDWDSFYITETETRITKTAMEKFRNQVLPKNSVMFTSLSFAFGKMGITSRPSLTNQQINSLIVNEDHDYRFVYYLLKTYKAIIFSYNSGIDTPIVPESVFENIKVRCPGKKLQQKIAAILSAYDDLIENYQQQIGLLEALAQNLYREWFVRGRCPYAQAQSGGLPIGWERVKVNDCFEILGGGTPSTEESSYWENGTINWYTPTDVTALQGIFLKESSAKISENGLRNSSARMFPAHSVMMTSRATIGAIAINNEPATTNQGFITCLPNERFSYPFIYFWIQHNKQTFEMLASGATFLEITKGVFKEIGIIAPPDNALRAFDKVVLPLFSKIENLQSQITQLRQMRDKLLPRLMSGQLAVGSSGAECL